MKCTDVRARLSAYGDGELDDATGSSVRGHLRGCAECRAMASQDAAIREGLQGLAAPEPPLELWSKIQADIAAREIADGERSSAWRWWSRALQDAKRAAHSITGPWAVPAMAMAAIALWFGLHHWRGVWAPSTVTAPVVATIPVIPAPAIVAPVVVAPSPTDVSVDVAEQIVADAANGDAKLQAAAAELASFVDEDRAMWPAAKAKKFDAEVSARRAQIARSSPGRARQHALRQLVSYLRSTLADGQVADANDVSGGA